MPKLVKYRIRIAAALVALCGAAAIAQEAVEETANSNDNNDDNDTIEEIIVTAPRPGQRKRAEKEEIDPVRAKLLKDFNQLQEDQKEMAWRDAKANESPARVKWGYDPSDEYRMRTQMDLMELPTERTKPATIFRLSF